MSAAITQALWREDAVRNRPRLRYDLALLCAIGALMMLGLVMVASASVTIAASETGRPLSLFWRQCAYVAVAISAMLAVARTPMAVWRRLGPWLLVAGTAGAQPIVYPAKGQSEQQTAQDKQQCYDWARNQTGFDPQWSQPGQATQGGLVRGAARGAAVGAVGGAIGGDAGKGAAIGAATGGLIGGMRRRDAQRQQEQAHANATANFERAWSACLQGRGYTVQ